MAVGFIATAQMEFLSLRQHQLARSGTDGTNVIQYINDTDMANIKSLHLLNSIAFIDAQAGRAPNLTYCDGAPPSTCPEKTCVDPCTACPCNPLSVVTGSANVVNGSVSTQCAVVDLDEFDPTKLMFHTVDTDCINDANAQLALGIEPTFIVRVARTNVDQTQTPNIVTIQLTYAVKDTKKFEHTKMSVDERDSLSTMSFAISAHIADWSVFIPGWTQAYVPHVP